METTGNNVGLVAASGYEAATTLKSDNTKIPDFQNKSCALFTRDHPFRKKAIEIAYASWFEYASISVILANCIFLMIADPLDTDENSSLNQTTESAEHVFNVLFTVEMLIKIVAMGFYSSPHAYLKDPWNVMDFLIVTLGLAPYFDPGLLDVSALRTIRVLRPLKTLSTMPGMRVIITALLNAVPSLLNVGVLCVFTFVILGIVGVQLYNGVMDGTCFIADPATQARPPVHDWTYQMHDAGIVSVDPFDSEGYCMMYEDADWPPAAVDAGEVMIKKDNGGRICEPIEIGDHTIHRYCGRHYTKEHMITIGEGKEINGKGKLLSFGTGNFDNIGRAFLSIYTSITLEGWVDIMYALYDAFGLYYITFTYFIFMILFGSLFMLNLTLAVVEGAMGDAEDEMENEEAEEAAAQLKAHPEGIAKPEEEVVKKGGYPFFRTIVQSSVPNKTTMFENFIVFAIIANTLVMALESYNPDSTDPDFDDVETRVLDIFNDIFTWIFVVELILKLLGLGVREYVSDRMNRFDFFITVIPVIEFVMKHANPSNEASSSGIGALRSFRLFRLFKLARSWKELNKLLHSLAESIAGCVNAALLLLIIMFIFTLLGMQFFGGKMQTCLPMVYRDLPKVGVDDCPEADDVTRGHFDSFWWAFVTVFQVLTGENWNEVLYYAIDGTSWELGAVYFILLNVIGNYIIFNIFLAILLGNMEDDGEEDEAESTKYEVAEGTSAKVMPEGEAGDEDKEEFDRLEAQSPPEIVLGGKAFWIFPVDSPIRLKVFEIIKASRFDNFILTLIFISSIMLAVDQPFLENCATDNIAADRDLTEWKFPNLAPPTEGECNFKEVLDELDKIITILFIIEAVLKIFALGFVMHKNAYLRNNWNKLDFFIVLISIINMASGGGDEMAALKSLRAMRALRPLRVVSRNPGMKLVVNSILKGLPEIGNVVVVCFLFYLIFAIIGVQNWKGALNKCNNPDKLCHPGVPIDKEHPSLTCCTGSWNVWGGGKRDCSECSHSVKFPDGLMCTPDIACGTGDGHLFNDKKTFSVEYNYTTNRNVWYSHANESAPKMVSKIPKHGTFYVNSGSCGMLSNDTAISDCESRAYCDLYDPTSENEAPILSDTISTTDSLKFKDGQAIPAVCQEPVDTRFKRPEFEIEEVWGPFGAHFDKVGNALLTVFECSSGEMWPNIMVAVMDSVGPDQPFSFDWNYIWTPVYFIAIQIMCAFLLLNLFVGVLIEQYNSMKDGDGTGPLITEQQKMWIETQRLALDCAPERKVVPPQNPTQRFFFRVVESRAFELCIMGCIMLNIVIMAMRVYGQSKEYADGLMIANMVFVIIFTIEMFLKLYALECGEYFKRNWNRFDFFIVMLSWTATALKAADINIGSFATLLRVARVARIFRLVQTNKNLATLFQTLLLSVPAIVNVASVTFLAFFVYAVMGMNLFAKVKLGENLTAHANFRSFWGSFMLLFRMSTGESYNGVMHDCRTEESDGFCSDEIGDCGVPIFAEIYFLSFFVVSAMLMFNILIAIILDNYGDQEEQDQHYEKVGPEDMQVFKQVWAEKDPLATGAINSNDLEWIIIHLPEPLGLATRDGHEERIVTAKAARNKLKELHDVPECNGQVFFHHVLRELVKCVHSDVDVSNLANNPRMTELDSKATHSKFEKKAKKQTKVSQNLKPNGEPFSVSESTASLSLQSAWRKKAAQKKVQSIQSGSSVRQLEGKEASSDN